MSTVIDGQWHRLDPRTIAAVSTLVMAPMVPTVGVMLLSGKVQVALITSLIWVAGGLVIAGLTAVGWWFTRYRITAERFELRRGNLTRSHRSIPRDRIRSVDLTADPGHRLFRIAVVKVGTGGQAGDGAELKLDAIARHHAETLRQELLFGDAPTVDTHRQGATEAESTLARLRPAWFGYSALTLSLVLIVWGALGSAVGSFTELLDAMGVFRAVADAATAAPVLAVGVGTAALLLVGVGGAMALSVEMWWGFRLSRERGGTLRVRRGLLTTRSISLEQRRLRGVEIAEPMLLRWAGAARLNAIATGLSRSREDHQPENKTLLPPAPRAEVDRVAAAVLREPQPPTGTPLRRHPRAALRRRTTWALGCAAPAVAAVVVLDVLGWVPTWLAVSAGGVAVLVACAFAVDAYRNLGHGLTDEYLITRSGTGVRRTAALHRSGIIGWRITQTVFQRRSGLANVTATTAAGSSCYPVKDVAVGEGLALAEQAVPNLLGPFLERH
ncbi:hypothetical protein GCM10011581_06620 [Saccharopolyspora subtropica]|uniref:YdbS-like PH domain-containing protein n=1 Tax=Saccharopolyspora thermophila TaxID=89367 RepID=A0A917JM06_9PSEU|nr:PH domain-containing protein [Saccharopolyspora subtropica]GGI72339.1 hypothetical protein GCM10011581_06620 [Saccharopolyspora subtropica]